MSNEQLYEINEWYSLLQQIASKNLVTGLPTLEDLRYYYDTGVTPEEAFQSLYPPAPVTVDNATSLPVTSEAVSEDEPTQELALAREIAEGRVTEADVLKRVVGKSFTMLPGGSTLICEITLENGFVAHGQSIASAGEKPSDTQAKALTNAIKEVWDKEVYLARERAYRQRLADIAKASIGLTDQSGS